LLHRILSLILPACLIWHPLAAACGTPASVPTPSDSSREVKLKARVLEIPVGTSIEVRLEGGEKVVGTMGEVWSDTFLVESVGGNPGARREIRFADLRSIKTIHPGPSIARPLLKALVVMGVAFGLTAIAVAGMD